MRNKLKPVYIMHKDASSLDRKAVSDGIEEMLGYADVSLEVKDLGEWRHPDWLYDGKLKPFYSVDWYVDVGKRDRDKLDAMRMLNALHCEPWRKNGHYDVKVVDEDMRIEGTNFVIGVARPMIGTVISTYRFRDLDEPLRYECVKTEAMHEFGHVLWLPYGRNYNVEDSLGLHCTNTCIMRQGMSVPYDWIRMSDDRIRYGALCKDCEKDLQKYF